jgi:hypothetical protein
LQVADYQGSILGTILSKRNEMNRDSPADIWDNSGLSGKIWSTTIESEHRDHDISQAWPGEQY